MDRLFPINYYCGMIFSMKQNDLFEIKVSKENDTNRFPEQTNKRMESSERVSFILYLKNNYIFFISAIGLVALNVSMAYLSGVMLINKLVVASIICISSFLISSVASVFYILKKPRLNLENKPTNAVHIPVFNLLSTIVILFLPSLLWSIVLIIVTSVDSNNILVSGNYISMIFLLALFIAVAFAIWYEDYLKKIIKMVLSIFKSKRR